MRRNARGGWRGRKVPNIGKRRKHIKRCVRIDEHIITRQQSKLIRVWQALAGVQRPADCMDVGRRDQALRRESDKLRDGDYNAFRN